MFSAAAVRNFNFKIRNSHSTIACMYQGSGRPDSREKRIFNVFGVRISNSRKRESIFRSVRPLISIRDRGR
ncbi:unnamed protein product [Meloidogyne enterolobii]|uniref:Uncharacterized protein n=1 Tax=Meloidogyne enterolobii TaxID=390850 RepID=A0ACB0XQ93_MELEN